MLATHLVQGEAGLVFLAAYLAPRTPSSADHFVIVAPAFAEEMNRSRRTLHHLGTELCRRGKSLIIPDLTGTGDSSGDFRDARWVTWKGDLFATVRWVLTQYAPGHISLLGIRLGATLAAACANELSLDHLLFWQPIDGKRNLKEFMRVWDVGSAASSGRKSGASEILATDGQLEIGGYLLTSELAEDLRNVDLNVSLPDALSLYWFELGANLGPMSTRIVERLRSNGANVATLHSQSAPFWRIQETIVAHDLIMQTVSALESSNGQ